MDSKPDDKKDPAAADTPKEAAAEKPAEQPADKPADKPTDAKAAPGDAEEAPAAPVRKGRVRTPEKAKRIAVAQIAPTLGDTAANLEKHIEAIDHARKQNVDLLVFPELSYTGYRLKDTVPDLAVAKGSHQMQELAKLSEEISFVIGLVEEDARHNFYNSAFLFESGHVQAVHRKAYLPTYGMFDEQRYFARGRSLAAFNCKIGRAAILICEDMLHPTALTVAALDGASTIIVPSASPVKGVTGEDNKAEVDANGRHWEMYNRSMARTLGLYIVHANRVGVEDGIAFWGGSEIVGPAGDTVAKAAYYDEDFITGQINEDTIRRRRTQAPVLRDENMDLTINELSRLVGRQKAEAPPAPQRRDSGRGFGGDRGPRRDDRGGRPGGGFGGRRDDRGGPRGDDRGPRRDDRGGPRGDDRGPRRDDRGPRGDDRGRPGGGFGGRRDDRGPRGDDRGPRRDDRGPRGDDRAPRRDDRGPRSDDRFPRGDDRGPRRDDRGGGRPGGGFGGRRDDRGGPRGGDDRGPRRDDRGPRGRGNIETGRLGEALDEARKTAKDNVSDSRTKRPVDTGGAVAEPVKPETKPAASEPKKES